MMIPLGCGDDDPDDTGDASTGTGTTSDTTIGVTSSTSVATTGTTSTSSTAGVTSVATEGSSGSSDGTGATESETDGTDTTSETGDGTTDADGTSTGATAVVDTDGTESGSSTGGTTGSMAVVECPDDDGSLTLPEGFCATVFADGLGRARHLTVTPSGDLFVSVAGEGGGVVALRDVDGDGVSDERETFGSEGGNGIAWAENTLFVGLNDRVERYTLADGELTPSGEPQVVVFGLPADGDHAAKTVVVGSDGDLFVNIGSATNSCQADNRALEEPGIDPCEELEIRAGIWRFDASTIQQSQSNGLRYASGVRNGNALAIQPSTGDLWTAQNGRDQLYENWPDLYTMEDDADLPAEEIFRLSEGEDYGWPYCYFDPELEQKVLAPEYGGDGMMTALGDHDCSTVGMPDATIPAHWAPLGMLFYRGEMFPSAYRDGLFIANHGSRFSPEAETPPGYNVVFIPFADDAPSGSWEPFASDFAGDGRPLPDAAEYRPVALAEAPDGSLYISDDTTGRIWRVYYTGLEPA